MGFGAQAVHSLAVRTVQAAEYDHLRHPVKPGGDEPMPPEVTVIMAGCAGGVQYLADDAISG
jgi:hypothetical protein